MFFQIIWCVLFFGVLVIFGIGAFQEMREKNYLNAAGIVIIAIIILALLKSCA